MAIERTEPAYSNDEVGMLRSFLDHYRATIRLQASGLNDTQLDQSLPPGSRARPAVGLRPLGRGPRLGVAQGGR